MKAKQESGQILVLVLLVVVVVLAVGLSVASRNLTNLRTSTQAEQSQRAFTAAEGGVEDVLSRLNTVANVIQGGTSSGGCSRDTGDTSIANCSLTGTDTSVVSNVKVKATSSGYEKTVEPGEVAQINLVKADGTVWTGALEIAWAKAGDPSPSTLEYIFVCEGGTSCQGDTFTGTFGQHREIKRNGTPAGQNNTGISACGSGDTTYGCKDIFTLSATDVNVKLLRIKPFWNRTTIKVTPGGATASTFPVQTYEITSTATTDTGVSRKVEVRRDALPQLPAIFDYALYSGGDIVK